LERGFIFSTRIFLARSLLTVKRIFGVCCGRIIYVLCLKIICGHIGVIEREVDMSHLRFLGGRNWGGIKVAERRYHYCGRLFVPDPRVGNRQKPCSHACQRLRKRGEVSQLIVDFQKYVDRDILRRQGQGGRLGKIWNGGNKGGIFENNIYKSCAGYINRSYALWRESKHGKGFKQKRQGHF
jgi:hypothetical protein